jgi:hypothetical protein
MSVPVNRRQFVAGAAATAAAAFGDFRFLGDLPPLTAQEANVRPGVVRFSPDIEPLVRMLEDTPRERIVETVIARIRGGTSYQELLAALMLAGVRSVKPRPVGFQFHTVLVINSAHQAAIAAQDRDRWLPLIWAADNFKGSQARHRQQHGDWQLPAINEAQVAPAAQARQRFVEAMDNWDEEGADRAISGLARAAGAAEVIEPFWRIGARDFRDIGHKAIYVANAWRTLQVIGWRHAEPILRSLAFALLQHEGGNPAQRDADQDRPGRDNLRRLTRVRAGWQRGRVVETAARDLLATLRTGTPAEASDRVVGLLNDGIDPLCVWDGLFMGAGELLMRQPGIVGLHTVTTVNALHFGYQNCASDETRRFLMLQAAAFLPMFRGAMTGRGRVGDARIDALERGELTARGAEAVEEVLAEVGRDRTAAARKTLALLHADRSAGEALLAGARRLIFNKGRDSHDYKFSSAALEDFYHATPAWRDRFLAASTFWLKGSRDADNDLVRRARAALS